MTLRTKIEKLSRIMRRRREAAEHLADHKNLAEWAAQRAEFYGWIIDELDEALNDDEQEGGE